MRLAVTLLAIALAISPAQAQTLNPATVAAIRAAATNWQSDVAAAARFTAKTPAKSVASNAAATAAVAASLLADAQALIAAQAPVPPPPAPPAPIPPAPPANSITVSDINGLNAALAAAPAGETILLNPGTYSGLAANGLTLPGVTVASVNPANPATLTGFYLSNASGLTFSNLVFSTEGSADPYPFRINTSSNITVSNCAIHGAMNGNPQDDQTGLFIGYGSDHITVKNCDILQEVRGVLVSASTNVLITGNHLHEIGSDGIDNAGSSFVTASNNWFSDFRPANGQHPDAIQFWTAGTTAPATDITITGNLYERATGGIAQGVFMGNELQLPYQRVLIANNVIDGAMYNGIGIGWADGATLTGNLVLEWDDQPSWLVLRSVTNATVTGNQAAQFSYTDATPTESGNVVIGAPADKGASAIAAWHVAHAGVVYGIVAN